MPPVPARHIRAARVARWFAAGLVACVGLSGCAATVRLLSEPAGATFEALDPETGDVLSRCVAPCEVRMVRAPGRPVPYRVSVPGRRTLDIDLMRTEGVALRWIGGALFQRGGREITVVLLDEHGPTSSRGASGAAGPAPTSPAPP